MCWWCFLLAKFLTDVFFELGFFQRFPDALCYCEGSKDLDAWLYLKKKNISNIVLYKLEKLTACRSKYMRSAIFQKNTCPIRISLLRWDYYNDRDCSISFEEKISSSGILSRDWRSWLWRSQCCCQWNTSWC